MSALRSGLRGAEGLYRGLSRRVRRVHWRRLNHILIPDGERRLQFANTRWGRRLSSWARPLVVATPLGRRFLAFTLLMAVLGLDAMRTSVHLVWCALAGLMVGSYVMRRSLRLPRVHVQATCASRVYAGQEVRIEIVIRNDGEAAVGPLVVEGPFLPWDGVWLSERPTVDLVPAKATVQINCRLRFTARGPHALEPFAVRALTPFGLFGGPEVASGPLRFLVVPRPIIPHRSLDPSARRHHPGGVALASRVGESPELMGIRPYCPGDRLRDLHARSWARHGQPMVRQWQEEFFARSAVLLDIDGTIAEPRQLEAAVSLAAGVVSRLGRGEALVDLLVVGDSVHALTIGRHVAFEERAMELLACAKSGPALQADSVAARLRPHLKSVSSLIAVLLAWDDPRARLVAQIQAGGIDCRSFVVDAPRAPDRSRGDGARLHLATEAIEKGEV